MSTGGTTSTKDLPPLRVRLFGEDSSFNKMVDRFNASVTGMATTVNQKGRQMAQSMVTWGRQVALTSALVGSTTTAAIAYPVKLAGEYEQASVAFEVMLGSANKAKKLLTDIEQMAAKTPLETTDLIKNSQLLSAYNVQMQDLLPTLSMIGDVALGNRDKFNHLSLAYAQVMAKGRLMGQEVLQMTEQGFNPLSAISKMTGRSIADLTDAMSNGEITAKMVTDAFKFATSEGGKYNNMMAKQSQTFLGLMSTVRDYLAITLRIIVYDTGVLEILKEKVRVGIKYLETIQSWVRSNKELVGTLFLMATYFSTIVAVIGVFGSSVMVAGFALKGLLTTASLVVGAFNLLDKAITGVQLAVIALRNSAIMAFVAPFLPVIAIVTAVGTAIIGITYLVVGPQGFSSAWETVKNTATSFWNTVAGFIYNFSHNMGELRNYVIAVWSEIWSNAGTVLATFIKATVNNIFVVFQTAFRLGYAFAGWLSIAFPELFRRIFTVDMAVWVTKGFVKTLAFIQYWGQQAFDIFQAFAVATATILVRIPEKFINSLLAMAPIVSEILNDILNFRIPDPVKYLKEFTLKAMMELGTLGAEAAEIMKKAMDKIGVNIEQAALMAARDFKRGASNLDFTKTAEDILAEQAAKLQNPFSSFGSIQGPNFKFDRPFGEQVTAAEEGNDIVPTVDSTEIDEAFEKLEEEKKKAEANKVKIKAKVEFEAAAKDSAEAFDRLTAYARKAGQDYIVAGGLKTVAKETLLAKDKAAEEKEMLRLSRQMEQHLRAKRKQVEIINVDLTGLAAVGDTA